MAKQAEYKVRKLAKRGVVVVRMTAAEAVRVTALLGQTACDDEITEPLYAAMLPNVDDAEYRRLSDQIKDQLAPDVYALNTK